MSPDIQEERSLRCIACRETIYPSAITCPHCGTSQSVSPWGSLSAMMKVVGGMTAVISLVIATNQISHLADSSRQKAQAATELASAATLLSQKGDRHRAMQLLLEVQEISPGLQSANELRAEIGMTEVRRLFRSYGETLAEATLDHDKHGRAGYLFLTTVDLDSLHRFLDQSKIDQLLARQAANSSGTKRARSLAHLAWMEMLLYDQPRIDIDEMFSDAEFADRDDAIVLAMRAAWLASRSHLYNGESQKRLIQANERYVKALDLISKSATEQSFTVQDLDLKAWVRALQIETMPAVDALASLLKARAAGEDLSEVGTLGLTRQIFITLSGWGQAPHPKNVHQLEEQLISRFNADDLIGFANWMAAAQFGCNEDGLCDTRGHESAQMLYAIGRLHELYKRNETAAQYYDSAKKYGGRGWWSESIENGLQRLNVGNTAGG